MKVKMKLDEHSYTEFLLLDPTALADHIYGGIFF